MTRVALIFTLGFALGCGSSAAPPAAPIASPPPAPTHPSDVRCKQAAQHLDELAVGSDVAPEQREARLQAVEQARAAGILNGDRAAECAQQWTDAVVDCVLAGSDKATANACIPAK
ncbi:MAG TPA: hypothetical protein VH143_02465 [Kofleriaceae bacterium]|jgi:hypothetical protein|nr:hypothetical protein [Kofleriaceae bacterium]